MKRGEKKIVYENELCRVEVEFYTPGAYGQPSKLKFHNDLFVSVDVIDKEQAKSVFWKELYPSYTKMRWVGFLWWKKWVEIEVSLQETRLEQALLAAIKFADKHLVEIREKEGEAERTMKRSEHIIEAFKEVGLIGQPRQDLDSNV